MKKSIIFLYGIVTYIIFLIAILYGIGFVGNFVVPKAIDTGRETSFIKPLLVDVVLLTIFALQHSVMARPGFKKWWMGFVDPSIERSTYVLLSSLLLLFLFWQWLPLPAVIWQVQNSTAVFILKVFYFFGWLVVFLSTFMINHFELFGLKQVFENFKSKSLVQQPQIFKTNFFYRLVRHPIMLGFLVAFWSTPVMTVGHLVFSVTTTLYILIAIKYLEEKDLLKIYGKEYEAYRKKVPMIIPFTSNSN
jgi:protein-S-isoprenylcysteine O-methyltransferase Ste14